MTATEWLINNSYAYWQNNADSWAEFFGTFGSALAHDTVTAVQGLVRFAVALHSVLMIAVAQANEAVEEFVSERTDESAPTTPDVSWGEALATVLHQDIIAPVVTGWAVLNIWESSIWLTVSRHI